MKGTSRTLHSLIDHFGRRIGHVGIVASGVGILDIVPTLEDLEALRTSVVNVLGVRDKLRRRRSVGSRHFKWRTG